MRIFYVITGLSRGGAEAMLTKVLTAIDRSRIEPAVISLSDEGIYGGRIKDLGIPVHCLGMRPTRPNPPAFTRLGRLIDQSAPDVIHAWMYHAAFLALLRSGARPVIVSIRHSLYNLRDEKPLTRLAIKGLAKVSHRAAHICYNSQTSRVQHEALGYAAGRSIVIPNGFDCEQFQPNKEQRRATRCALGIGDDQIAVLHLARFHPMKDHAGLLAAIRRLESDHRYVFLLAGTDVTCRNQFFSEMESGRVRLLGERDDIPELLNGADMLISSSKSEAFPNVLGEAMACGVPCVATDVGDSAHIVGDTGLIVPPRNPDALAVAVERMANTSPAERAELGARARQRVRENFSLPRIVEEYVALYEHVASFSTG